jgi:hypothetical protein
MLKHLSRKKININQQGVVSILVSVIIMIILTLIAVGFAQIMRREQRQALDRQLSAQALYAAETAINDATLAFANGEISANYSDCDTSTGPAALNQNVLDVDLGVSYTCVTLDSYVQSLEYDSIGLEKTKQTLINPVDQNGNQEPLNNLKIFWEGTNETSFGSLANATNPDFPTPSSWPSGRPGLLRVEIIPLRNGGNDLISRNVLMDSNNNDGRKVFFLYPSSGGTPTTINWTSAGINGGVFSGNCDESDASRRKDCVVTIDSLPGAGGGGYSYLLRIKSIYRATSVSVIGNLGGVGNPDAYFSGAQIVIDATGKANDVLRRVRANVTIDNEYPIPEFAIQSYDGLCKRLQILDTSVTYGCPN